MYLEEQLLPASLETDFLNNVYAERRINLSSPCKISQSNHYHACPKHGRIWNILVRGRVSLGL